MVSSGIWSFMPSHVRIFLLTVSFGFAAWLVGGFISWYARVFLFVARLIWLLSRFWCVEVWWNLAFLVSLYLYGIWRYMSYCCFCFAFC